MTMQKALLTIIYTAVSGGLSAFLISGVAPEVFADSKKLWMTIALLAAKDVGLLLSNVDFKKELGIFQQTTVTTVVTKETKDSDK